MGTAPDELTALVNRCFLVGMDGTALASQFRDWLANGLGGVVLFGGNIVGRDQLARLCTELRDTGDELLVAADEEGGDITRLHARSGSPTPGNLALGAVDDPALTRSVARSIGTELSETGINLNLAPVVDVNTAPDNPIIGTRAFGSDADHVARHTVAYVEGLHEAGMLACAKHFPGHGDANVDSHLALPVINGDITPHLTPFRAAIDAGVDAVLSAHIVFPTLDDQPATLSQRVLTGLLREELGFTGTIITDSLTMSAIADTVGVAEGAVRSLAAGADLLCMNSPYEVQVAARDQVVAAIREGRLPEERVRDAANRTRVLAQPLSAETGETAGATWTTETSRRALYVDAPVPLGASPFVIEITRPRAGIEPTSASLLEILRARDGGAQGVRVYDSEDPHADLTVAMTAARGRPLVLVVKDAHRQPTQHELVAHVRAERHDAVVVGIGTTADARVAPGHYIGARSGAAVMLTAVADLLLDSAG